VTRYGAYENKLANRVEVIGGSLVVEVTGMQRAIAHLPRLVIPLGQVLGAAPDPEIERSLTKGRHTTGGRLPGIRSYNVRGHREKAITILLTGEEGDVLVTEVDEPAAVAVRINLALEASDEPSSRECVTV
jgi:hypothetical protein